jgi:hypothetical protein
MNRELIYLRHWARTFPYLKVQNGLAGTLEAKGRSSATNLDRLENVSKRKKSFPPSFCHPIKDFATKNMAKFEVI